MKIKSGKRIVGAKPFSRGAAQGVFTGRKTGKNVVSGRSATRLFARNPAKMNSVIGTSKDSIAVLGITPSTYAMLSTALAGANNDLVFTAKNHGVGGNAITVRYVDPAGNNQALSVGVVGNAITVNLATGVAGAITSTAAQVRAAVLASAPAMALLSAVTLKTGNDGTGVVIAMAATNLTGGAEPVPIADGVPNQTAAPNPRKLRAPQTAVRGAGTVEQTKTPTGVRRVINRATNRRVRSR